MAYLRALFGAITGGVFWWLSLVLAYFFQVAAFSDYGKVRDAINSWQSMMALPAEPPLWLLVVPFMVWVIARLAHNEAMRHIRAAKIEFSAPFIETTPLYNRTIDDRGFTTSKEVAFLSVVKIKASNIPHSYDDGKDVRHATKQDCIPSIAFCR
jgi:hypothetical protein